MADEKLEHVLRAVDPAKRALVTKMVVGVAFAVPTVASFAVKDVAFAEVGSPGTTVITATQTVTKLVTVSSIFNTTTIVITTTRTSTVTTTSQID